MAMHQTVDDSEELLVITRLNDGEPILHEQDNGDAWISGFVEVPE